MKSALLKGAVTHNRFAKIRRSFSLSFPWWVIRFSELEHLEKNILGFSSKHFSLYQFKKEDHINLEDFLKTTSFYQQGEEIKDVILITNPRCFGYVFNPVSFYIIEGKNKTHAIIEIGNTFSELKPYYVSPDFFKENSFIFRTTKKFYISPFLSLQNSMLFQFSWTEKKLKILIEDYNNQGELEFIAHYQGEAYEISRYDCLKTFLRYPWHTFIIIFLIHWHAFMLWLQKVPWYKKNENLQDQTGVWKWKQRKFQPTNLSPLE